METKARRKIGWRNTETGEVGIIPGTFSVERVQAICDDMNFVYTDALYATTHRPEVFQVAGRPASEEAPRD